MLLRLIIAIIVAVVVSIFYQGYIQNQIIAWNLITAASFIVATLISALLGNITLPSFSEGTRESRAPSNAEREEGTVKWFNVSKGFGFITRNNGEDIFVHYRSIRGHGRRRLFDGQVVSFVVIPGDKGAQADDIVIIKQ